MTPPRKQVIPLKLENAVTKQSSWYDLRDYFQLLYWIIYFPQATSIYRKKASSTPIQLSLQPSRLQQQLPAPLYSIFLVYSLYGQIFLVELFLLFFLNLAYWGAINYFNPGISSINHLIDGSLVGSIILFVFTLLLYVCSDTESSNNPITFYIDHAIYFIMIIFLVNVFWLNPQILSQVSRPYYFGIFLGTLCGTFWRTLSNVDKRMRTTALFLFGSAIILMLNILFNYFLVLNQDEPNNILLSYVELTLVLVMGFIIFSFVVLRPDDWLLSFFICEASPTSKGEWKIPHVSTIHFPRVLLEIEDQLKEKWKDGLQNIKAIISYSYQRPYIIQFIKRILLKETPNEKIMERVWELYYDTYYHDILFDFVPRQYNQRAQIKSILLSFFSDYERHKIRQQLREQPIWWTRFSLDTSVHSVIAGLWYLENGYASNANEAFLHVQDIKDSEEIKSIVGTWNTIFKESDLVSKAPLKLPKRPEKPKFGEVWNVFSILRDLLRCMWVFRRCHDQERRDSIKGDALLHVKNLEDAIMLLQQNHLLMKKVADRLKDIVDEWEVELRSGQPKSLHKIEKIENPYIFSEPLRENLPARRTGEIANIKEAWTSGNFQPLLIYGQRHIGKTSLMLSLMTQQDTNVELVHVNVSQLAEKASQKQLLWAICKEVEWKTKYITPSFDELIRDPHYIFRRYMQEVCDRTSPAGLIIVLDQLDYLDNLFDSPITEENTLRFLWELSQTESKLCFVFVTIETPREIADKYSNPFVTGSKPIQIGYMNHSEVHSILRNPNPDFLPYFDDEAISTIFELTNGHPYLVQVLAYSLIDRVSLSLRDSNNSADPLFMGRDIENNQRGADDKGVVNSPEFIRRLEHYCSRVRIEISIHERPISDLLRILACTGNGLREDRLKRYDPEIVKQSNLQKLVEHQIIAEERKDNYTPRQFRYQVELFRKAMMFKIREALTDEDKSRFQNSFPSIYPQITKGDFGKDRSQIDLILLDDSERVLARCSVWSEIRSDDIKQQPGFIGHYAAENRFVGSQLLDHACNLLWQNGCTKAIGPVHRSIYKPHGLRTSFGTETANRPPFHDEPNDPSGSRTAWQDSKFKTLRHYRSRLATLSENGPFIDNVLERSLRLQKYSFRAIDINNLEDDINALNSTATDCLYNTQLQIPILPNEFLAQFEIIKNFVDSGIVLFGQHEDRIIGFIFALPNRIQIQNGEDVDTLVIQSLAVLEAHRGKGIGKYLSQRCHEDARLKGYRQVIHAMIPYDNAADGISQNISDQLLRRYTLYERTLQGH